MSFTDSSCLLSIPLARGVLFYPPLVSGAQRMLGGQAAVWITLVTAEQRLARQWAERTQGTEPRREPPALDLEMPQNGTGRRGQGPLVKSVNGARDPLPLLTPGGSEGSLPPSLGATDVTNVFSFNSGGSRGKKKKTHSAF